MLEISHTTKHIRYELWYPGGTWPCTKGDRRIHAHFALKASEIETESLSVFRSNIFLSLLLTLLRYPLYGRKQEEEAQAGRGNTGALSLNLLVVSMAPAYDRHIILWM